MELCSRDWVCEQQWPLENGSLILCGTAGALCLTVDAQGRVSSATRCPQPTCGPASGRIVHRIAVGPVCFVTYRCGYEIPSRQVPETVGWRWARDFTCGRWCRLVLVIQSNALIHLSPLTITTYVYWQLFHGRWVWSRTITHIFTRLFLAPLFYPSIFDYK